MDVDLEREAKQNAAKLVSSNLQRTNNLEQIKQSKKLRLNKEVRILFLSFYLNNQDISTLSFLAA